MAHDPHSSRNQSAPQHSKRRQQHQQQHQLQHNNEHDDEVGEEIVSLPYRKAYEMAETFAATRVGQFIITRGDSMLKTIETTAKWSLPKAQLDDKLQRPLPWIPFLMLIITLRLARVWLSIAALMIGNSPINAHDVVYFIQTRRRKLRALRLNGVKEMNERKSKSPGYHQQQGTLKSQVMNLLNRAFCRPGQHYQQQQLDADRHHVVIVNRDAQIISDHQADHQAAKRLRSDDDCDVNLTLDQMLDKYSVVNSDDDPDFVPDQAELSANETSATSTASSESADEGEALLNEQSADQKHNQSVEMIENGNNMETLPKPIMEIKKENQSDVEEKQAHENGPTNGGENRAMDVGNGY